MCVYAEEITFNPRTPTSEPGPDQNPENLRNQNLDSGTGRVKIGVKWGCKIWGFVNPK